MKNLIQGLKGFTFFRIVIGITLVYYAIYNFNKLDVFAGVFILAASGFVFLYSKFQNKKLPKVLIGVLLFIGLVSQIDLNKNAPNIITQSKAELIAKRWIKTNYLADPDSYNGIEFSQLQETETKKGKNYALWHSFRAKNRMGLDVFKKLYISIDSTGEVIGHVELD